MVWQPVPRPNVLMPFLGVLLVGTGDDLAFEALAFGLHLRGLLQTKSGKGGMRVSSSSESEDSSLCLLVAFVDLVDLADLVLSIVADSSGNKMPE